MYRKWEEQLANVTWGYRDKFSGILNNLIDQGYLNTDERSPSFQVFNQLLIRLARDEYILDVILNEFLLALDQNMAWLLRRPELLEEWGNDGLGLIDEEWYYARKFFQLWAEQGLQVRDPEEMRFVLSTFRSIKYRADIEVALSFLEGYHKLRELLTQDLLYNFINEGLRIYKNNPETSKLFFTLELSSSRKTVERLKTDCQLDNVRGRMQRLSQAICGKKFEVENFSMLDSDELLEKDSHLLCLCNGLYVPQRVSIYSDQRRNINHYLAVTYLASFSHLFKGFPFMHGYPGFETSEELLRQSKIESSVLMENLFFLTDIVRIVHSAIEEFPGIKGIIKELIECEYHLLSMNNNIRLSSIFEQLLYRALYVEYTGREGVKLNQEIEPFYRSMKKDIIKCNDFYDLIKILPDLSSQFKRYFGYKQDLYPLRPLTFFSDYRYRAVLSSPVTEKFAIEGKSHQKLEVKADKDESDQEKPEELAAVNNAGNNDEEKEETKDRAKITGYFYDEWNNDAQDYLSDWCCLQEIRPGEESGLMQTPLEIDYTQIERVKRIFERIKPDVIRREKHLQFGDDIVVESLIRYMVEKKAGLFPYQKVYSRFYKEIRDITVSLLIDVSGSTAEEAAEGKVLEIEKRAVFTLAEGLQNLGDRFGVFGFSGSGKDNCRYYIYKDFSEEWGKREQRQLFNVRSDSSTRIGVAIRHSIARLKDIDSAKKLIILITDGKPQDNGYSPENGYAQYDIRQACLEALRENIVVFGISTEENSLSDLEIMFPERHYLVIRDINKLPELLVKYYLKLTI